MKHTRILLLIALLAAPGVGSSRLDAATITVMNTNDSGAGSLRQALVDAVDGDTINFNASLNGQITLTSGQLMVDKGVNITGPGANRLAVNANHASRVFYIASGKDVTISGLTITNGSAPSPHFGGGIYNDHATLTLSSCTISGNAAEYGIGGGIFNDAFHDSATLYVLNCTLSGNSASYGYGGGIGNDGYQGTATLTVLNSTLSGNWATFGGAIYTGSDTFDSARMYVFHTTFSGNSASSSGGGGGIYNAGAITKLANTVFNASSIFRASGMIRSLGHNLCSDDGSGFLTATGDQINTDPMLGPLQDNGGPTFTHTLLSGSPAIDSGDPNFDPYSFSPLLLYDQRGDGFERVVNDHIDIGAFEVQLAPTPTPPPTATPTPVRTPSASKAPEAATVTATLASMTLNPATVTGGANSTGTVTLSAAAPAGGAVVALTSNNLNAATVPASITVAAGATTATFTVTTKIVTIGTVAIITPTYNGISKAVGLVVNPLLGSLTLNPSVLIGGAGSTGTVTLTSAAPAGGAVVTLTSGNTNAATVPAAVTVAAGATSASFTVTTKAVTTVTQANITATAVGASRIVTLTLNPPLIGVTVNPGAVKGGVASTGKVTLGAAAPTGGAVVILASSNLNAATVPASVTVTAGATSATFTVTTKAVTAVNTVTITATYNGMAKTAKLTVNPPLVAVTVNPTAVTGGTGSTGTVKLGAAAPAGGAVVTLASNNLNAATVPASVTVPANATAVTFAIATKTATAVNTVTITATYSGMTKTAKLTVNPPAAGLVSVTVNPTAVTAGTGSTGTVTLGATAPVGGAVVTLASNNVNAATVPASATVPANATTVTFAIATNAVTAVNAVTVTATYNGVAKTAVLTVNPPAAGLIGVSVNPTAVTGGTGSTGTVTLGAAAPAGGAVVTLASNNVNAATMPASVTVPANATTVTFAIATNAVTAVKAVTITATYNGVAKTAVLTVNPPAAGLVGVTVNPTAVTGGMGSTGTVTLGAAAPAGGAVVTLASSNLNAATVPVSVTVPANATTVTFAIATKALAAMQAVTITATYNGVTKTATLTVNPAGPAALAGVAMNPATVIYGANSTGTVTLTSAAPAGGAVIALAATNTIGFTVPASVTVPLGATTAQFTVGTYWFPATTTITATYNGVAKAAVLTSVDAAVVGLTCNPNPVIAGTTTTCTATLNGTAPEATTVFILSDQPFFAPVPATATVPAGATSTNFPITTTLVPDQIVSHISASALATASVTTPLTINLTNRGRKWVLNNVVFKDGGTASGYFTYDPATGQYLDANIQVTQATPVPDPNNPLGQSPQNLYYYPWPNGTMATFVDNWSTASEMALQNPVTNTPVSWTYLQFNFAQPLTNAGGTIPLVVNPNVAYTPYCSEDYAPTCTPPPPDISQESFALPDNLYGVQTGFFYRVVVSGSVTAQ